MEPSNRPAVLTAHALLSPDLRPTLGATLRIDGTLLLPPTPGPNSRPGYGGEPAYPGVPPGTDRRCHGRRCAHTSIRTSMALTGVGANPPDNACNARICPSADGEITPIQDFKEARRPVSMIFRGQPCTAGNAPPARSEPAPPHGCGLLSSRDGLAGIRRRQQCRARPQARLERRAAGPVRRGRLRADSGLPGCTRGAGNRAAGTAAPLAASGGGVEKCGQRRTAPSLPPSPLAHKRFVCVCV